MANKIKEILSGIKDKKRLIVILGIIGVLLIALSELIPSGNAKSNSKDSTIDYVEYTRDLEAKTVNILSSIDGVGKCKAMITLEVSDENVYAKNTDEKTDSSSHLKNSEYVLYERDNDDTPILIKQYFPKVYGVVVVCQGGDDVVTREKVISSVSSLYGISTTKISVSKLNG